LEIVLHAWLACLRMMDMMKLFHLYISIKPMDWGIIYRATVCLLLVDFSIHYCCYQQDLGRNC
jgi:hypothetical protein